MSNLITLFTGYINGGDGQLLLGIVDFGYDVFWV